MIYWLVYCDYANRVAIVAPWYSAPSIACFFLYLELDIPTHTYCIDIRQHGP